MVGFVLMEAPPRLRGGFFVGAEPLGRKGGLRHMAQGIPTVRYMTFGLPYLRRFGR
jgi:hypothetical protein